MEELKKRVIDAKGSDSSLIDINSNPKLFRLNNYAPFRVDNLPQEYVDEISLSNYNVNTQREIYKIDKSEGMTQRLIRRGFVEVDPKYFEDRDFLLEVFENYDYDNIYLKDVFKNLKPEFYQDEEIVIWLGTSIPEFLVENGIIDKFMKNSGFAEKIINSFAVSGYYFNNYNYTMDQLCNFASFHGNYKRLPEKYQLNYEIIKSAIIDCESITNCCLTPTVLENENLMKKLSYSDDWVLYCCYLYNIVDFTKCEKRELINKFGVDVFDLFRDEDWADEFKFERKSPIRIHYNEQKYFDRKIQTFDDFMYVLQNNVNIMNKFSNKSFLMRKETLDYLINKRKWLNSVYCPLDCWYQARLFIGLSKIAGNCGFRWV